MMTKHTGRTSECLPALGTIKASLSPPLGISLRNSGVFPSFPRLAALARTLFKRVSISLTHVALSQTSMTKNIFCDYRIFHHVSVPKMHRATRKSTPKLAARAVIGHWPWLLADVEVDRHGITPRENQA